MKHKLSLVTFFLSIIFLFVVLFANSAFAHHPSVNQSADCEKWEIIGEYVGGPLFRRLEWDVTVTVDGVLTSHTGSWENTSDGFEVFNLSGSNYDTIIASGYLKQFKKVDQNWVLEKEENVALSFDGNCVSPTLTPTNTPTSSPSASPSSTPTMTLTVAPTHTPGPTSTPQPGPTATPAPGPTATPSPEPPKPQATPKGLEKGVQYGNK